MLPTILAFHNQSLAESNPLGDKIIICTGWGIKYVSLSEAFGGEEKSGNNDNTPQTPFSKNHCPLCINPSLDANAISVPTFISFLETSLSEKIQYSIFDSYHFYESDYHSYLTSQAPPTFS